MINMNDPEAPSYFVNDISRSLEGNTWRWTGKRPTVKVLLPRTTGLKYVIDFVILAVVLKQTGPITVSFFIGDRLLDRVRYTSEGARHFEKPVNPEWLQTAKETEVSAEPDKLYVAPEDQTKLGLLLIRMGFESVQTGETDSGLDSGKSLRP